MPSILVELGCEELPAVSVEQATISFLDLVKKGLEKAGLSMGEGVWFATPRRMILAIDDVPEVQPDMEKSSRGPGVKAAFDASGNPTPALLGFCRGQSIDPSSVVTDGDYVWAKTVLKGRPTSDVLAEVIPEAIRSLQFPKSMRWGSGRMRFARPIRWILATYGGSVVPFELENIASGSQSCGHRFLNPELFTATSLQDLLSGLRQRSVEPDPNARETRIREGLAALAGTGQAVASDELIRENVYLTEWPMPTKGSFRDEFLGLPEPVLITAMAKHEKSFPIRDAMGSITNEFICIRNSGDETTVSEGFAWVLNARFGDAKFFYESDEDKSLGDFLELTSRMTFQEVLGTVRQRADRLAELTRALATELDPTLEADAFQAGLFAKADLSTGLVSELASLQGIVGAEYGRRSGLADDVCYAIETHYTYEVNCPAETRREMLGMCLSMADQLDKLAGYLGIDLAPSGSSDPYAQRRAVTILIESGYPGSLLKFFELAGQGIRMQGLPHDDEKARQHLESVLFGRYQVAFEEIRHDIVEAAMPSSLSALFDSSYVAARVEALSMVADDVAFVQSATRPINIVSSALSKGETIEFSGWDSISPAALNSSEATALLDAARRVPTLDTCEDVVEAVEALLGLKGVIDAFFDSTMVMDPDPTTRGARLGLVMGLRNLLLTYGNFSTLVIEG
jgi:glycyl-tRNA synthetase beta chain